MNVAQNMDQRECSGGGCKALLGAKRGSGVSLRLLWMSPARATGFAAAAVRAAAYYQLGTSGDSALELEPLNSSKSHWRLQLILDAG